MFREGFGQGCVPTISSMKTFMHASSPERWKIKSSQSDGEEGHPAPERGVPALPRNTAWQYKGAPRLEEIGFTSCQTSIIQNRMATSHLPSFWKNHSVYLAFGLWISVATLFGRAQSMLLHGVPGEKRCQRGPFRPIGLATGSEGSSNIPLGQRLLFFMAFISTSTPLFQVDPILKSITQFQDLVLSATVLAHKSPA